MGNQKFNKDSLSGLPNTELQITNLSDIEAKPLIWLWKDWLPLGKLVLLAGVGGGGKTNLLLALIAIITRKGDFPDGSQCDSSGSVLIYSTEDDPADTLKLRLIANDADISKVSIISGRLNQKGEMEAFDPSKDFLKIKEYVKSKPDLKLLMIDPIVSAVGGDMNKANDVRKSLQPLVDLANEYGFSVIGISHFSKGTSGSSPAERVIGSQAFTALARMVWSVSKRENGEDCILVRVKSNNLVSDGGIRYQIESTVVLDHIETTKIKWLGIVDGTAKELLNEVESVETNNMQVVEQAKEFLINILSGVEKMPKTKLEEAAKAAGYSWASIRRAQIALGIKPFKLDVWYWKLSDSFRNVSEVLPTHL